jgi:hypothetical protein
MYKGLLLILVCSLIASCLSQAFQYSPDWGKNGKRSDFSSQENNHPFNDIKCVVDER